MKYSNNQIKFIVFIAVILIVFNVIVFAVPFQKNSVFWLSYIFGMISILLQILFMYTAFNGAGDNRSKFYGFPIARIGIVYAIVQILLSISAMAVGPFIPVWIPIVLFTVTVAVAAIGLIAADTVRDEVIKQDEKIVRDVKNMRNLQSKMNVLVSQADCSESIRHELKKLSEELKYSDPVSSDSTQAIENELYFNIEELQRAVVDGDDEAVMALCKKTTGILAERNRLCKLNKNAANTYTEKQNF